MPTFPIYILCAPIQSGKTTALRAWVQDQQATTGGILCPDRNGLRHLLTVHDGQWHAFQLAEAAPVPDPDKVVQVGRFRFRAEGFALARAVLRADARRGVDWLIIDEIGKLELQGRGLEPAAGELIRRYQTGEAAGRLLLVVRPELLEAVLARYAIKHYLVVDHPGALPE